MRKTVYLVIILLLPGCAYLKYAQDPFVDIPNFSKVNDTLYRGGRPNEKGLLKLQSLGIKTAISLRGGDGKTQSDRERFLAAGMQFYNLPMSIYEKPSDETVLRFLEIVLNKQNQPVFVFCKNGRDRTGAMIAVYRVTAQGWGPKEAYKEAKNMGFWPYRGEAQLKVFIHQLRDKTIFFDKAKELLDENQ